MCKFTSSNNLKPMIHYKRLLYSFLLPLFILSNILPWQSKTLASKVETQESNLSKGLLDDINSIIRGEKQICIAGLCINSGQITESLLAKQIQEIAAKNAPITVSSKNLYSVVSSLPSGSFRPKLLDLRGADSKNIIPPGDYAIPVNVYCLQKVASSPPGHRYILGKYGGKNKEVLAALNLAAANYDIPHRELQNLSWAIQSGVSYQDMPKEMQELVIKLIPQHRSKMKQEWWGEIEKIWNIGSQKLNLPSFEQFFTRNLGDVGRTLIGVKQARERIVARGNDWRNLSEIFMINDNSQGVGNVLSTPWSQIAPSVYARFVTEGNATDVGLLLLRIQSQKSNNKATVTNGNKALPLLGIAIGALTVYDLYDIITTLMALPEGNQNIQPLAISPYLAAVDVAMELCETRKVPRGRISAAVKILCNLTDKLGVTRVGRKLNTVANIAKHTSKEAVEKWASSFRRFPTTNKTPNHRYQIKHAGSEEIEVIGGGTKIRADGIRMEDGTLLESKFIKDPKNSPYVPGSTAPDFIRKNALNDIENEFRRYAAVIRDKDTPMTNLEIITNEPKAVQTFQDLLNKYQIPGRVIVKQ